MYYFYIFRCKDKTLYSGVTNNPEKRARLHNSGKGSIYVKTHGGGKIVHKEKFKTLGDAMRREAQVKKWPRVEKKKLIQGLR